jgi:cytochrome P450
VKSPPGIPLIGHLKYLTPRNMLAKVPPLFVKYGHTVELFIVGERLLLTVDMPTIREVLTKRPKLFRREYSIEPAFRALDLHPHSVFVAEGPAWGRLRRLLSFPFNSRNVDSMYPMLVSEVDHLIERLNATSGTEVNVGDTMMEFTLRGILRVAFGNVSLDEFFVGQTLTRDITAIFDFLLQRAVFPLPEWCWTIFGRHTTKLAKSANARLDAIVGKIVTEERERLARGGKGEAGDSFIRLLLLESTGASVSEDSDASTSNGSGRSGEGRITDLELVANIKTMLLAGSETTSVTLTWALFYLATHADAFARARQEADHAHALAPISVEGGGAKDRLAALPFCSACFKEVLRLCGPALFVGACEW